MAIIPKALEDSYFGDYLDSSIVLILLLSGLVVFKIVATAITFGSGGVGGIFAPTLFMGQYYGECMRQGYQHSRDGGIRYLRQILL